MHKQPNLEKERSEERLSSDEFLASYNKDLPKGFPRATQSLLDEFKAKHPNFFKRRVTWSLGEHRKRLMDWLPGRVKEDSDTKT